MESPTSIRKWSRWESALRNQSSHKNGHLHGSKKQESQTIRLGCHEVPWLLFANKTEHRGNNPCKMPVILYCSPCAGALKSSRLSSAHTTHGFCLSAQRISPLQHSAALSGIALASLSYRCGEENETNTR